MTAHGEKGVLVTGASRGLGLETALTLAKAGFRVWAGVRDTAKTPAIMESARQRGVNIEPLQLEVTDQDSVDSAFETIARNSCPLYGIVNNAGITARAYFEDFPEDRIRKTFEVNVFGTMRVTRRALPLLRKAGRSRIIMISSIGGRVGSMSVAPYVSSKFAVEGFSESLALEVKPFGVDVVIIEPGMVKTEIWDEERRVLPQARDASSPYYEMFWKAEAETEKILESSGLQPKDVAQLILHVMTVDRPRLRYVAGDRARLVLALVRYFPGVEKLYFRELLRRITTGDKRGSTDKSMWNGTKTHR
jgi:NAD(P)-dependent dehydrogenase (short-subunit alcohol dehydrogenase family)